MNTHIYVYNCIHTYLKPPPITSLVLTVKPTRPCAPARHGARSADQRNANSPGLVALEVAHQDFPHAPSTTCSLGLDFSSGEQHGEKHSPLSTSQCTKAGTQASMFATTCFGSENEKPNVPHAGTKQLPEGPKAKCVPSCRL